MKNKREKERKFNFSKLFVIIILLALIAGGVYYSAVKIGNLKKIAENNNVIEDTQKEPKIVIPEDSVATIVAIGDTLCHTQNFKDADDSETGIYDFSPMFKYITKYFDDATVAVGNLEATFAGPSHKYSGYPTFNTPEHLAIDLKELGLDIMTTANNHALDIGYSGLVSTLDYLDDAGLQHRSEERRVGKEC